METKSCDYPLFTVFENTLSFWDIDRSDSNSKVSGTSSWADISLQLFNEENDEGVISSSLVTTDSSLSIDRFCFPLLSGGIWDILILLTYL